MAGNGTNEQEFTESDLEDLRAAKSILEDPSLTAQIRDYIGTPIEKVLENVPEKLRNRIGDITHHALLQGLNIAVASLGETDQRRARVRLHKVLAVGTGVTGGLLRVYGPGRRATRYDRRYPALHSRHCAERRPRPNPA